GAALVLGPAGANARAAFLPAAWHYDWGAQPPIIVLDAATSTEIHLTNEPPIGRKGSTDTVPPHLSTTTHSQYPSRISNILYKLTLVISDDQSPPGPGSSHTFVITGEVSGTVSKDASLITNHFDSTAVQGPFSIGTLGNTYSLGLFSFTAPSGPNASNQGAIGARVTATGHDGPIQQHDTPEP